MQMIDRLQSLFSSDHAQHQQHGRKVLRMVTNDRTAGSIPCWENVATPESQIERNLSLAQSGIDSSAIDAQNTLAYQPTFEPKQDNEFTFADLVDMVNPLQHIPVVNHFYRKITGDEIKPIGKIIGGTVFGGPAGFAGGIVNLIVEKETGRDITGNAIALVTNGERPHLKNNSSSSSDLPAELLAFAGTENSIQPQIEIHNYNLSPKKQRSMWGND